MAGPGIRYHNIARILKEKNYVDLAVFSESDKADENYLTIKTSGSGFKEYFDKYDFIFAQWLSMESQPVDPVTWKGPPAIVFAMGAGLLRW